MTTTTAIAAKSATVSCCTTEGGTYTAIAGVNSCKVGPKFEWLDSTNFATTAGTSDYTGAVQRIPGLTDVDCSFEADYIPGDTNGQTLMLARCPGGASQGTTLWFKVIPTGVAGEGWRFEAYIDIDVNLSVKGKAEASYKLVCNSKPQLDNAA